MTCRYMRKYNYYLIIMIFLELVCYQVCPLYLDADLSLPKTDGQVQ